MATIIQTNPSPTLKEITTLFDEIEAKFPATLGKDNWILVAVTALIGVEPDCVGILYGYLVGQPRYESCESRQLLIRRIREVLVKCTLLLGTPKSIHALFAIVKVEKPEDKDYSFSRENWQAGPENHARGTTWLKTLYKHNLDEMPDIFSAHKDFEFMNNQICYGLCLSDHSILGPVETELVTLTSVMIQGLPVETGWHLRGIRRLGVEMDDVEMVHRCVELVVARFRGLGVGSFVLPRAAEIEDQV